MIGTNLVADLSHWEATVDFGLAKADIIGVLCKATEGIHTVDPTYNDKRKAALAAGLLFGSFHFGIDASGSDQADHYLATIGDSTGQLLALDVERSGAANITLAQTKDFIARVMAKTGVRPGIYGGEYLRELVGSGDPELAKSWLWISDYRPNPAPQIPKGWSQWTFWQYTEGKAGSNPPLTVSGIGPCDRDTFNGSETALRSFWASASKPGAIS